MKNKQIKPENGITELVMILDRSGSMGGLESDTIGGFNAMLAKQRDQTGTCYVTTVLFDHEMQTLHDRVPLQEVPAMTEQDYTVRGCTALLDAVGQTVRHIESIHKYARPEDVPQTTLFVITTDGKENASKEYTTDRVKQLIEEHTKKDGWEFLFIGANIDAVETAGHMGIARDRAVDYHADSKGTKTVFRSVAKAVGCARAGQPIEGDWCAEIRADYESR